MKKTKFILFVFLSCFILSNQAQNNTKPSLRVASFNLRMDTPKDSMNSWKHRKEMVNDLIQFYDIDIIGTQEGFIHQIQDIVRLKNYDYVGVGRDDGVNAGEHSAIIFNKSRLYLLDKGDFWFSETPHTPSLGWDANIKRICSWAKFRDLKNQNEFYFFSLHYDHQGAIARKNSSLLLLDKVKDITNNCPVVVTGDFNSKPEEEPMQILFNDGYLLDSRTISKTKPYGTIGTFSGFNVNAPMINRIDYILVNSTIEVRKYGVLNDMPYGKFPSDHFPVIADLSFH